MSPEAFGGLAHADRHLQVARLNLDTFPDVCARHAYMAGFHAAQAFIFDRTGRVAKTHKGVRSEFARLARAIPDIPAWLPGFLGRTFEFKQIADYGADPAGEISRDAAHAALGEADAFVAWVRSVL